MYKRLQEELAKLEVRVNEEKTKVIHLKKGETFNFLGFDFRERITKQGKWSVQRTPMMKARTNLLQRLKIPSCKSTKKLQKLFKLYHKIKKYFQFTFCVTLHRL
ncbi:hypothetical protein [Wolbachia endosymbiont (group A) of Pogonocherus hispidulus]|uniref:hypothetical protein n=1 Tax=Wolbachia endosymbiont (group A) of Pogonocherus hispidulus TaxID=3066136 RepID=UPI003340798C